METREKGEKYTAVVKVTDTKDGKPTIIKVSGNEFVDAQEFREFKRMYAETAKKLKEMGRDLNKKNMEIQSLRSELKGKGKKIC